MADYLLDTNIILRIADDQSIEHNQATQSVSILLDKGDFCYLTPQVLLEYFSVLTRPRSANGFGWNAASGIEEIDLLLRRFPLLDDVREIFHRWRALISDCPVGGRRIFDYRLVAVSQTHGVTHILTYDIDDFPDVPGISIIHPRHIVSG